MPFGLDIHKAPPAVRASSEPIIRFFSYHDAHPIALGMVCNEAFGFEWLTWDDEALRSSILSHFSATSISDQNWQKIQAFRTLLLASSPWYEWEVFEKVIQSLNNRVPDFEVIQRCTLAQMVAGVDMMSSIREIPFQQEVAAYVASSSLTEGVMYLPDPLDFAQDEVLGASYLCLDCGNIDEVDLDNGQCDVCSGRFDDEHPLNSKPAEGKEKAGKNIRKFNKRNPDAAKKQFEAWKGEPTVDIDETNPAHVQAAKLVVAHRYMLLRRSQLVEQLEELKGWVQS